MEVSCEPRIRKLIGTVALLALVVVWSLLAMVLAQVAWLRTNGALDFVYYVVAGWDRVPLAMRLISDVARREAATNVTLATRIERQRKPWPRSWSILWRTTGCTAIQEFRLRSNPGYDAAATTPGRADAFKR